jgi:hypothetical protein
MLSALMMIHRLAAALRVALREEDFARRLGAALVLISSALSRSRSAATAGAWQTASTSRWPR